MGEQRESQRESVHLHPVNSGHSLWIPSFPLLESDRVDAGQSKKPGPFHTSLLPLHGGLYLINSFHAFHGCFQVIESPSSRQGTWTFRSMANALSHHQSSSGPGSREAFSVSLNLNTALRAWVKQDEIVHSSSGLHFLYSKAIISWVFFQRYLPELIPGWWGFEWFHSLHRLPGPGRGRQPNLWEHHRSGH